MLTQLYAEVRPLTGLLRRLLADGCPIAKVPAEVARMQTAGEIKLSNKQLPSRWWLVLLADGRLSIETDDPWHPIDPNHILFCERLPPPRPPIVIQSTALMARRAREKTAAPVIEVKPESIAAKSMTARESAAEHNRRIHEAKALLMKKPDLAKAELREKRKGKPLDGYTECAAEIRGLTYREFLAALRAERKRRRAVKRKPKPPKVKS